MKPGNDLSVAGLFLSARGLWSDRQVTLSGAPSGFYARLVKHVMAHAALTPEQRAELERRHRSRRGRADAARRAG